MDRRVCSFPETKSSHLKNRWFESTIVSFLGPGHISRCELLVSGRIGLLFDGSMAVFLSVVGYRKPLGTSELLGEI